MSPLYINFVSKLYIIADPIPSCKPFISLADIIPSQAAHTLISFTPLVSVALEDWTRVFNPYILQLLSTFLAQNIIIFHPSADFNSSSLQCTPPSLKPPLHLFPALTVNRNVVCNINTFKDMWKVERRLLYVCTKRVFFLMMMWILVSNLMVEKFLFAVLYLANFSR